MVQGRRVEANKDFSGTWLRVWQVSVYEVLDSALLFNVYCFHVRLLARL